MHLPRSAKCNKKHVPRALCFVLWTVTALVSHTRSISVIAVRYCRKKLKFLRCIFFTMFDCIPVITEEDKDHFPRYLIK